TPAASLAGVGDEPGTPAQRQAAQARVQPGEFRNLQRHDVESMPREKLERARGGRTGQYRVVEPQRIGRGFLSIGDGEDVEIVEGPGRRERGGGEEGVAIEQGTGRLQVKDSGRRAYHPGGVAKPGQQV